MREFKDSVSGNDQDEDEERREIGASRRRESERV
jgi:hypothetical protein